MIELELTFPAIQRLTKSMDADARSEYFACLPELVQRSVWSDLARQERVRRWMDDDMPRPVDQNPQQPVVATRRRVRAVSHDPLLSIAPPVYFAALASVEVPSEGGMVCCPLHDDHEPSCRVYSEPERGWVCFAGCGGGTIIDLAREVSGVGDRGKEFLQLRQWIARRLLEAAA